MALFGRKKKIGETAPPKIVVKTTPPKPAPVQNKVPAREKILPTEKTAAPKNISPDKGSHGFLLHRPRITEKASLKAEAEGVYVFEVSPEANKETIFKAIIDVYNVTPRKISIAQTPSKNVSSRGKRGVKAGGKKAYVYLAKGDKIELI